MPRSRRSLFFKLGLATRSVTPEWTSFMGAKPEPLRRHQEISLQELYWAAENCNALRKSIQSLRDYLFVRGYKWEEAWTARCLDCGEEVSDELEVADSTEMPACPECGSSNMEEPDPKVTKRLDKFFRKVNRNGHTLIEVLKQFENHIEIADDAFLLLIQDYDLGAAGNIAHRTVKELFVPDPRNFASVLHPATRLPGGRWWICLRHRPVSRAAKTHTEVTQKAEVQGQVYEAPGTCRQCNGMLHEVFYVALEPGSLDRIVEYYVQGEVIHESKYSIEYGYGYSQVINVYNMAMTLISQERYIKTFYDEERTPRAALFIPTGNPTSVKRAFKEAEDKNVSQNGHYVPKFTYDPGVQGGSKAGVQLLELSKLPEELQALEFRDEYYRRIGAAFDVAPVFHGNVDAVGLQAQGPTQWQVTVLGAQKGQAIYNDKVFPKLMEYMGADGWRLVLEEPEEKDEMQEVQIDTMKAQYGMTMQQLGFAPTSRDSEGNFEYPAEPTQPDMMGMMGLGGMGGGMPPPGGEEAPDAAGDEAGAVGGI